MPRAAPDHVRVIRRPAQPDGVVLRRLHRLLQLPGLHVPDEDVVAGIRRRHLLTVRAPGHAQQAAAVLRKAPDRLARGYGPQAHHRLPVHLPIARGGEYLAVRTERDPEDMSVEA